MEEQLRAHYGKNACLYEILNAPKNATASELKKAYKRQALKFHPDKNKDGNTTEQFQILCFAHSILSDPERRKDYDETGEFNTEDSSVESDWLQYWRALFPKVTEREISAFEQKYVNSQEEKNDLFQAYKKHKGNMAKINQVMLFSENNESRYYDIIQEAINSKELRKYPKFDKKQQKRKKVPLKSNSASSTDCTGITKRQKEFDTLVGELEKKYAKKTKKAKKMPPTDEEFEAIQKKLLRK